MNPPELEVLIDVDPRYSNHIDEALLRNSVIEAAHAALLNDDRPADVPVPSVHWRHGTVSIRITDDLEMQRLNREYRGVDRPTDVLSFAFAEEETESGGVGRQREVGLLPPDWPRQLGDIALSYPYADRQAGELGHSVSMELAWLTVHGTLQLLGYSHYTDRDAEHMEHLERTTLRALGFQV